MNIAKLKDAYFLWKDISTFPCFLDLFKLSTNYYNNILRVVFCSEQKNLYDICFQFPSHMTIENKPNEVSIDTNLLFGKEGSLRGYVFKYNYISNYKKYNFSKNFRNDFLEFSGNDKIIKWCLISELIEYIRNTIQ